MEVIDIYRHLVGVDSVSKNESAIKTLLREKFLYDYDVVEDDKGNLIIDINGNGSPILLNAHLDRVPPGKAHIPKVVDGVVFSDGLTNSGADDAVGLAIIIKLLNLLKEQKHRSLKIVFTVEEEIGLFGAKEVNVDGISEGIIIDNAIPYTLHPSGGVIINKGAAIHSVDIEIFGVAGHSGKNLSGTVNVLSVFNSLNLELGSLQNDQVRVNIGSLIMGDQGVRNKVPDSLKAFGEIRSVLPQAELEKFINNLELSIMQKVHRSGGKCDIEIRQLAKSYEVDLNAPLVKSYSDVLASRNAKLITYPTFIGSDCQAFREKGVECFVVSTGVDKEHTLGEEFSISYAEQIVEDLFMLLRM